MEAYAISKYNRVSTKKLRRVAMAVNRMNYNMAQAVLSHLPQKGAKIIRKTLISAGANLLNKEPASKEEDWLIKAILVNRGPYFKRTKPRARGRADQISKPTSHLTIVVSEKDN